MQAEVKELWKSDYSTLKAGDVFKLENILNCEYRVLHVHYTEGGGGGMGAYPPEWSFITDKGVFTYDPWVPPYKYRRFLVVASSEGLSRLEDIWSDKELESREKRRKEWEMEEEKRRNEHRLRKEALANMTPEQRRAFGE